MNKQSINRRSFSKMIAGSLLTGSVVEAAVQEQQRTGALSDDTALILLDHLGYKPTLPDEMKTLKPMLETLARSTEARVHGIRIADYQLTASVRRIAAAR